MASSHFEEILIEIINVSILPYNNLAFLVNVEGATLAKLADI
jgi:hypothetical protein